MNESTNNERILRVYKCLKPTTGDNEELYNAIVERRTFDKNGLNKFGQSRIEIRIIENLMILAKDVYKDVYFEDLTFEELETIVRKAIQTKNFKEIYREITEKRGIYYTPTELLRDASSRPRISMVERAKRRDSEDDFLGDYPEEFEKLLANANAIEDGRVFSREDDVAEVERIIKLITVEGRQDTERANVTKKAPVEERTISDVEIEELAVSRSRNDILRTMSSTFEFLEEEFKRKGDRDEY